MKGALSFTPVHLERDKFISKSVFIVAPCILIYVEFTHQQMHFY